MKNLVLLLCLTFGLSSQLHAQFDMKSLPTNITDIAGSTDKIVSSLTKEIGGLTSSQQSSLKSATTSLLGDYNKLIPKQLSDPTKFSSELTSLAKKYDSKFKKLLGAENLEKFLGKGSTSATSKILGMLM
jgi:hypothetical protein